jgi:hypothetical protein
VWVRGSALTKYYRLKLPGKMPGESGTIQFSGVYISMTKALGIDRDLFTVKLSSFFILRNELSSPVQKKKADLMDFGFIN